MGSSLAAYLVAIPLTMGLGVGGTFMLRGALGERGSAAREVAKAVLTAVAYTCVLDVGVVIVRAGVPQWGVGLNAVHMASAFVLLSFLLVGVGVTRARQLRIRGDVLGEGNATRQVVVGLFVGCVFGLLFWALWPVVFGIELTWTVKAKPLLWLKIFNAICVAAWAEEILFRWYLLDKLKAWFGSHLLANVGQAALATLLHFPFYMLVYAQQGTGYLRLYGPWLFILALTFGILRSKTKGLLACFVAHGVYNVLVALLWPW